MKNKTILYLISTLAFIILVIVLINKLPLLMSPKDSYKQKVNSIKTDTLASIEIEKGKDRISFTKDNNLWKSSSIPLDQEKVTDLINKIIINPTTVLIAETERRHKEFELTGDTATKIYFTDKVELLTGKAETNGVFARFADDNKVYLIEGIPAISYSDQDWFDKNIIQLNENNINKIKLAGKTGKISLIKADNTWKAENTNEVINQEKVNTFITNLVSLKAQNVHTVSQTKLPAGLPELSIDIESDKKISLQIFVQNQDYLAKTADVPAVYSINQYQYKDINLNIRDFVSK